MKRIPKSFQLAGLTFTVGFLDEEEMLAKTDGIPAYGVFIPSELAIYLRPPSRKLKKELVLQTFWHEYFHAMFWVANHRWRDEKLVDQCGHLTYQMLTTAKF